MTLVNLPSEKINSLLTIIGEMEALFENMKSIRDEINGMINKIEPIGNEEEEETIPDIKPKVGRPRKYNTEEERKEAKRQSAKKSRDKKRIADLKEEIERLKNQLNNK